MKNTPKVPRPKALNHDSAPWKDAGAKLQQLDGAKPLVDVLGREKLKAGIVLPRAEGIRDDTRAESYDESAYLFPPALVKPKNPAVKEWVAPEHGQDMPGSRALKLIASCHGEALLVDAWVSQGVGDVHAAALLSYMLNYGIVEQNDGSYEGNDLTAFARSGKLVEPAFKCDYSEFAFRIGIRRDTLRRAIATLTAKGFIRVVSESANKFNFVPQRPALEAAYVKWRVSVCRGVNAQSYQQRLDFEEAQRMTATFRSIRDPSRLAAIAENFVSVNHTIARYMQVLTGNSTEEDCPQLATPLATLFRPEERSWWRCGARWEAMQNKEEKRKGVKVLYVFLAREKFRWSRAVVLSQLFYLLTHDKQSSQLDDYYVGAVTSHLRLSRMTGLPKRTVRRVLAAFEKEKLVRIKVSERRGVLRSTYWIDPVVLLRGLERAVKLTQDHEAKRTMLGS